VPLSVEIVLDPPAPVMAIELTGVNWLVMVISRDPVTPEPSAEVAVTVTVPLLIAVTNPPALMVASPLPFVIDHVTDLFVAVSGSTVALSWRVPLSVSMVLDSPERFISRTFMSD